MYQKSVPLVNNVEKKPLKKGFAGKTGRREVFSITIYRLSAFPLVAVGLPKAMPAKYI